MTSTGSYEDLFKKEISKYDHICEEISQNIQAQEQLLMQIQAQNDQFSVVFNLEDFKASREKCFKQIEAAIAKYQEIKENINEGLKFYVTLQDAITNVKQQCSDFVMTRNIQCREMMEDVQRQISGLSFQDRNSSNQSYPSVGQNHQPPRTMSPQQTDNVNISQASRAQAPAPYYQPSPQQTDTGNVSQAPGLQAPAPYYQSPQNSSMPGYATPK